MSENLTFKRKYISSSSSSDISSDNLSPSSVHIHKKSMINMSVNEVYTRPPIPGVSTPIQGPLQGQGAVVTTPPGYNYQFTQMMPPQGQGAQLSEIDINRIAVAVKNMLSDDLHQHIEARIAPLADCVQRLSEENKRLHLKIDELEMYSRKNCIRVFGVPEDKKDTDAVIHDIATKLEVPLAASDLAVSHRVGKPSEGKPRAIIARITNYNTRHALIKNSKHLAKSEDTQGWSVNQELTKARSKVAYEARQLAQANLVKGTFVWDGKIFVIDKRDVKHQLVCLDDLLALKKSLLE